MIDHVQMNHLFNRAKWRLKLLEDELHIEYVTSISDNCIHIYYKDKNNTLYLGKIDNKVGC